jgi:hypothetical protein
MGTPEIEQLLYFDKLPSKFRQKGFPTLANTPEETTYGVFTLKEAAADNIHLITLQKRRMCTRSFD